MYHFFLDPTHKGSWIPYRAILETCSSFVLSKVGGPQATMLLPGDLTNCHGDPGAWPPSAHWGPPSLAVGAPPPPSPVPVPPPRVHGGPPALALGAPPPPSPHAGPSKLARHSSGGARRRQQSHLLEQGFLRAEPTEEPSPQDTLMSRENTFSESKITRQLLPHGVGLRHKISSVL